MSVGSDCLVTWIDTHEVLKDELNAAYDAMAARKVQKAHNQARAERALLAVVKASAEHYVSMGLARTTNAIAEFPKECRKLAVKTLLCRFDEHYRRGKWAALQAEQKAKAAKTRKRPAAQKRSTAKTRRRPWL